MPKKKKTLKQKMQADQRRQTTTDVMVSSEKFTKDTTTKGNTQEHTPTSSSVSFSLPSSHAKKRPEVREERHHQSTSIAVDANEYSYLSKDLLKTSILTFLIVIAEIVIKFFFERG